MSSRVAHIVQHLRPGGLEVLACSLAERDANHILISLDGTKAKQIAAWPRLSALEQRVFALDKKPGFDWRLPFMIRALAKRHGCAALHTHHIGPLLYGGIAARLGFFRHVHTEHDVWHLEEPSARKLEGWALRLFSPAHVALSPAMAERLHELFPASQVTAIENGIDTERFKPADQTAAQAALGLPPGHQVIGCAARLETVKGVDLLIEAFARLDAPGAILVLAGEGGEDGALRSLAARLGVGARVHFLGALSDMAGFYPALDLYVQPSRNEGLPLAPLEALSSGAPVIATRVGQCGLLEPLGALVVAAEDIPALTHAMAAALADPGDGAKRRAAVQAQYDLSVAAARYDALYAGQAA